MTDSHAFLFATCQLGAEAALKAEVARAAPELHLAFSRPGFVTFKCPGPKAPVEELASRLVFARTVGQSLGRIDGQEAGEMADRLWQLVGDEPFRHLHVWQRDAAVPGDHDFEPEQTVLAEEIAQLIAARRPGAEGEIPQDESESFTSSAEPSAASTVTKPRALYLGRRAKPGEKVLDCVLVEPTEWWVGRHSAAGVASRYPGGILPVEAPEDAVSRAYLKTAEALDWFRVPVVRGERCVELGCAPGGSCQALLDRGLEVIGVDPAEMDPAVLARPGFRHLQKRGAEVKRNEFRGVRWLTADLNVAPPYTLDTVEAIVTHPEVHIRGMLLTLKLLEWELAEQVDQYVQRIRSWGYHFVQPRQLAHNRQEFCVYALRNRYLRRHPGRRRGKNSSERS